MGYHATLPHMHNCVISKMYYSKPIKSEIVLLCSNTYLTHRPVLIDIIYLKKNEKLHKGNHNPIILTHIEGYMRKIHL